MATAKLRMGGINTTIIDVSAKVVGADAIVSGVSSSCAVTTERNACTVLDGMAFLTAPSTLHKISGLPLFDLSVSNACADFTDLGVSEVCGRR